MNMHAGEKSDKVIRPQKRPNKGEMSLAEAVEGRGLTKGNLFRQNKFWTQDQERMSREG